MVVSLNRGTPIKTPKYYNPSDWDIQNGTPNFGKAPSELQVGIPGLYAMPFCIEGGGLGFRASNRRSEYSILRKPPYSN